MNIAVIVESRPIDLKEVVSRHLDFLPGWEYKVVKDTPIRAVFYDYNHLLTSISFWDAFSQYERVLIFQHDSGLLREGIDEFLEWDYVGAPWKPDAPWAHPQRKGGNGGLSLRSPRMMVKTIINTFWRAEYGNEDVYFCRFLESAGGNVAPFEVCNKFSCETVFQLGTLGYHAIESHLSSEQVEEIKHQYQCDKV